MGPAPKSADSQDFFKKKSGFKIRLKNDTTVCRSLGPLNLRGMGFTTSTRNEPLGRTFFLTVLKHSNKIQGIHNLATCATGFVLSLCLACVSAWRGDGRYGKYLGFGLRKAGGKGCSGPTPDVTTPLGVALLHWSRYRHLQQCHAVPCCAMLCLPALAKKHRSLLAFDKQGVNCSVNCSEFS